MGEVYWTGGVNSRGVFNTNLSVGGGGGAPISGKRRLFERGRLLDHLWYKQFRVRLLKCQITDERYRTASEIRVIGFVICAD